jgi:hypothetical protein
MKLVHLLLHFSSLIMLCLGFLQPMCFAERHFKKVWLHAPKDISDKLLPVLIRNLDAVREKFL